LMEDVGMPTLNVLDDRFMLCGSPGMLKNLTKILNDLGFTETRRSDIGEYVIERAFVDK